MQKFVAKLLEIIENWYKFVEKMSKLAESFFFEFGRFVRFLGIWLKLVEIYGNDEMWGFFQEYFLLSTKFQLRFQHRYWNNKNNKTKNLTANQSDQGDLPTLIG